MFNKLVCFVLVIACLTICSVDSFAQTESAPLAKYLKPVQLDSLDVILGVVDMMYRDFVSQMRLGAFVKAHNERIRNARLFETSEVDLSKLDIFNYFFVTLAYNDSMKKIGASFLITDNVVNSKTNEGLKQFMASCFDQLTKFISALVPEFDEKRDFYVEFSSVENPNKKVATYLNGNYVF